MTVNVDMKVNGGIVCLSIFVAFVGAYTTINLYDQYRLMSKENRPKMLTPGLALFLMACSLGGVSIWTMHFVAMSSVSMYSPIDGSLLPVRYRIDYTLISLVVVVALSWLGLHVGSLDKAFTKDKSDAVDKFIKDARSLSIAEIRKIKNVRTVLLSNLLHGLGRLVVAGVITAAGVCVMHYLGMQGMVYDGEIEWNGGVIAASVIIAIVAATAAFWILFRLLSFFPRLEVLRLVCSIVASLAVNGMHYTGQAAATFTFVPGKNASVSSDITADQATATVWALVISSILLFSILLVSMADLRVWYYNTSSIIRELDMRAIIASAGEKTSNETFLSSYNMLRSTDGSSKAIAEFRIKIKNSDGSQTSTGSGSHSHTQHKSSIVHIDDTAGEETTTLYTAADVEAATAASAAAGGN